jgi:hypothetical protein
MWYNIIKELGTRKNAKARGCNPRIISVAKGEKK